MTADAADANDAGTTSADTVNSQIRDSVAQV